MHRTITSTIPQPPRTTVEQRINSQHNLALRAMCGGGVFTDPCQLKRARTELSQISGDQSSTIKQILYISDILLPFEMKAAQGRAKSKIYAKFHTLCPISCKNRV